MGAFFDEIPMCGVQYVGLFFIGLFLVYSFINDLIQKIPMFRKSSNKPNLDIYRYQLISIDLVDKL